MRSFVYALILVLLLSCFIVVPGRAGVLSVSNIYIEPKGYEDSSTHEWKGSFWVVAATTDTQESYLFYKFNETSSASFGQNKVGNDTIIPTATIKITITPKQPYWEIPLTSQSYMVYPKTYGTYFNYIDKIPSKITDKYVLALYASVLECTSDEVWTQHTPFDVTIEKTGSNSFTKTVQVDTVGGTSTVTLANPADTSEKLMINDLGKIGTGYGQPSVNNLVILNKTIAFERTETLLSAIKYGLDTTTGTRLANLNYAFYWFGGGSLYRSEDQWDVKFWTDDGSPSHTCRKTALSYNSLIEDNDFPGSYRKDGPNFWDQSALPIAASILYDNSSLDEGGLSLASYLNQEVSGKLDLDLWKQGWAVTSGNKLRINMPHGAASSLITVKISTELADSVVYQPIVGCGKCEEAFWDSTKTGNSTISDNDTAVLKIKQYASATSKITVTPTIPSNVPASITPAADSATVDPNGVHTFQFKIKNLGTQANQTSTVTFTVSNDLGTVTDTKTLGFELIKHQENSGNPEPSPNPQPEPGPLEGDPMWIVLVAVIVLVVGTVGGYTIYSRHESRKKSAGGPKT